MEKLENIFSFIRKFSMSNGKCVEGEEVIKYIQNNYKMIQNEVCQERSSKRRTFGRCEKKLIDDFVEICHYRCDVYSRNMVNKIMTLLQYGGYNDKKPRFRQRMENIMKKMRRSNKPVRPSNRGVLKDRKVGKTSKRVSFDGECDIKSDVNLNSNSIMEPQFACNEREIVAGLNVHSVIDLSESPEDNEWYIFPDDIEDWKREGRMKGSVESHYDIEILLDENKDNNGNLLVDNHVDSNVYSSLFEEGLF